MLPHSLPLGAFHSLANSGWHLSYSVLMSKRWYFSDWAFDWPWPLCDRLGLTRIDGVDVTTVLAVVSEVGADMSKCHPGDDLVRHRLQHLIGRRGHFDEDRFAVGVAPVHAVRDAAH